MALSTTEFLERCLASPPEPSEIAALLGPPKAAEDLWLDYKSGRLLSKPAKERNHALQRFVSGFANADGGVLVIGVDDDGVIDGCPRVGGSSPAEWASRVLGDLAAYLVPSPRIWLVDCSGGTVLCIAVQRAAQLCPCVREGRPTHFLRIGDQTLEIDGYLYADLVLGRRERPTLDVSARPRLGHRGAGSRGSENWLAWDVTLTNAGLVWVPAVQVGVIGHGWEPLSAPRVVETPLPRALVGRLDRLPMDATDAAACPLKAFARSEVVRDLSPISSASVQLELTLPKQLERALWRGALFVVPSNGAPVWTQLEIRYDGRASDPELHSSDAKVLRDGERPETWWGSLDKWLAIPGRN